MAEGQVGFIPSGGAFGYSVTTDPEADQSTHELNVNVAIGDIAGLTAALAAKAPLAAPALTGAAQLTGGDFTFVTAAKGPVIVDASDGHTYRIISTAGVLSTVQVT